MTQKLTELESDERSRHASEDPYAATRARMTGPKQKASQGTNTNGHLELKHWQTNSDDKQRRDTASFITLVSVAASIATIFSAMQGVRFSPPTISLPAPTVATVGLENQPSDPKSEPRITDDSGALDAYAPDGRVLGQCPLKHTTVDAKVSGYTARVTVKQIFRNPFNEKIEARYRFPLSHEGAVDDMTMKVGDRLVVGEIKGKEDARQIYQKALVAGNVASLLEQERTNVFTQSIANLESGKEVEITIKYTEILNYRDGAFQFVFPTVVGERFDPYGTVGRDNDCAAKLTSFSPSTKTNTAPPGTRAGHDISINVAVDAGLPITNLNSHLHGIIAQRLNDHSALVSLKQSATIPNRDFVLDIGVARGGLSSGYVTTKTDKDGFVTIMVMPPKKIEPKQIAPRELIFLVDCSGSQSGQPIQKSRETLKYVVDHANENDTFQIITFNDTVKTLFDKPEKLTLTRKLQANMFIDSIKALGGTWMEPAVEATCAMPADDHRLRIVSFMTDGFVGNDYSVIALVKKLRANSRWFPFGVGDSVNRTLIDGISKEGGGESEFVLLNDSAKEVGRKFYERIASPVLTDVHLSTSGIQLLDVYPRAISDVWSDRPLFFKARYVTPGEGRVFIKGYSRGKPYCQEIKLQLPAQNTENGQIGQIWAKAKIDSLMSDDWEGAQTGVMSARVKNEIVKTALSHHLLSQFTSFVAVDKAEVTKGNNLALVDVLVNAAQGVENTQPPAPTPAPPAVSPGSGITYGCSNYDPNAPANPVVNKVIGRAFAQVTQRLNSLSCASCSASVPLAGMPTTTTMPETGAYNPYIYGNPNNALGLANPQLDSNLGDWLLLPWSFFAAPFRVAIIILLVAIAAFKSQRISKQVRSLEELNQSEITWTVLLFSIAIALTIGHVNILNFPAS